MAGQMLKTRCDKPGHMAKDCEVCRKHTCSKCGFRGHMEVFCHKKTDELGKGRGDSKRRGKSGRKRDGVRKIGDQPEQSNVKEATPVKMMDTMSSVLQMVSQTLYLL